MQKFDQIALFMFRPEALFLPVPVVCDDRVRRIQNILRRPVILFQTDDFRVREHLLELQNVLNVCASEFIDRLIVVANHADVVILLRQHTHEDELRGVGILIFIH